MIAAFRLYALLTLTALLLLAGSFNTVFAVIGMVVNIFTVLLLVADCFLSTNEKFLTVKRDVTGRLSIGRLNEVSLTIINQGSEDLEVRLKDGYPAQFKADVDEFLITIPKLSKLSINYNVTPFRRGNYQFKQTHLRYLSSLKLFWRQVKFNNAEEVRVFNDLKMLNELSVKLSRLSELGEIKKRKRGAGTEFASLKEYQVGDDSRFIDWKATARRNHPVVRTYDVEHEQNMLVLVDAGRMMVSDLSGLTRFDHALNSALALALTGLARGDQVGIGIFAHKPICYLAPKRGKTQLKEMLELVFDVQAKTVEPDYSGVLTYFANQLKGRALLVLLTDITDTTASESLLNGLSSLRPRHLPFCVTLRDKQIDELSQMKATTEEQIYKQVAALDLVSSRELALATLSRKGCLTLDSPPELLTSRLIEHYLDVKARNQL